MKRINRREFVISSAAAGLAAAAHGGPAVMRTDARPVVVSSANGNRYKNGGPQTCVEKAFTMMTGGADVLDALIAGVNIVELDPLDDSVGYGGLPNADGVVQLDSSAMHGPKKRAGAVGALEGVRTPSLVAKAVMEVTDHHLLVGKGAQDFARNMGFKVEEDLNTEKSRALWLEWKRRIDPQHYLDPKKRGEANIYNLCSFLIVEQMRMGKSPKDAGMEALRRIQKNTVEKRLLNPRGLPNFGINFYIVNKKGEYAGVSMYSASYAVCTENGPQTLKCEPLLEGRASD